MSPLAARPYLKMNGIGNAIVVLDLRDFDGAVAAEEARAIAAHEPFDQLMALHTPRTEGTDAFMRIYNRDGSEAGACGNGTRCVAWHLMPLLGRDELVLQTATTPRLAVERAGDDFTVDMGAPRLGWADVPLAHAIADTRAVPFALQDFALPSKHRPSALSMGNPHLVFWVEEDPARFDLAAIGPLVERHPLFPEGVNVSLAHILDHRRIALRVWERGAGLTLACGSAACAAAVAAARLGLTQRSARVSLPGGVLAITWREDDGHVLMTGPVMVEHRGALDARWFAAAA